MKKILTLCLAVLMLSSTLFACKSKEKPEKPEDPTSESTLATEEPGTQSPEPTEQELNLPAKQNLDRDFTIVMDGGQETKWYINDDVDSPAFQSSALNKAFYARNQHVEKELGVTIDLFRLDTKYSIGNKLNVCVNSDTDFADMILGIATNILPDAIPNGYLMDLNKIKALNLDASYWDQRIQQGYQINGRLFTLEGDYTVFDELCTYSVLYNERIYNDLGYRETYGSPYQMVADKEWTLEAMVEMFTDTSDINSTPNLTINSQWGLLTESVFPSILFIGSGFRTVTTDPQKGLQLLYSDPTQYRIAMDMLDDILGKIVVNKEVLFADAHNGVLTDNCWGDVFRMFAGNQSLFYTTILSSAIDIGGIMEEKFGVLPTPMYSSDQDGYYSFCSTYSHMPLSIPLTARSHVEETGAVIEALGYYSRYPVAKHTPTVIDAEFEWLVINKICRGPEDRKMLELIFSSKVFDIDSALRLTKVQEQINRNSRNRVVEGLAGQLESLQIAAGEKLDKFLTDMNTNMERVEALG